MIVFKSVIQDSLQLFLPGCWSNYHYKFDYEQNPVSFRQILKFSTMQLFFSFCLLFRTGKKT